MPDTDCRDRPIRFVHRDAIVEVVDATTTQSVLYWLRERARLVGTKEGCNEGDCGACMVIVASRDVEAPDGVALAPVNACLQFVAALDGKALITVEDLGSVANDGLHPAQAAMVACHGSQCGFCTPGFTMSLAACYDDRVASGARATRSEIADALSGNLCRCTGYRPILDAGEAMFDQPCARIDRRAIAAKLALLAADPPLLYRAPESAAAAAGGADAAWVAAPRSIEALAAIYAADPDARLVAGTTDVGLWITKQFRPLSKMIRIDAIDAMKRVALDRDILTIGAGASLEAAWSALVDFAPSLDEMRRRFASRPLRLVGTMGGSIANGSPIGDAAPVLLALDAVLVLRRGGKTRRLPLVDFQLDYMRNALDAGEFIEAIEVPRPAKSTIVEAYKISKRYDCDISAVALACTIDLDGGRVVAVRFAFGGMAATCRRAVAAEAAVVGATWDAETVERAVAALAGDFTPLSDLRASAAYRLKVAGNLLRRFWMRTRPDAPLDADATTVWPPRETVRTGSR